MDNRSQVKRIGGSYYVKLDPYFIKTGFVQEQINHALTMVYAKNY